MNKMLVKQKTEEFNDLIYLKVDKDVTGLFKSSDSLIASSSLVFSLGDYKEFIKLEANGDIFVKGNLIENDKELVQGLRELLEGLVTNGQH